MYQIKCDHCQKAQEQQMFSLPKGWVTVYSNDTRRPLEFCSWECVKVFANWVDHNGLPDDMRREKAAPDDEGYED